MLGTLAGITRGPRANPLFAARPEPRLEIGKDRVSGRAGRYHSSRAEVVARDPDQGFLEEQLTRTTFPVGSRSNRQIDLSRVERFHQGNAHVDHPSSFTLGYVFANWHKSSGSAVRDEVLGDTQMQSPIQWGVPRLAATLRHEDLICIVHTPTRVRLLLCRADPPSTYTLKRSFGFPAYYSQITSPLLLIWPR
jgi:hypothetical protein